MTKQILKSSAMFVLLIGLAFVATTIPAQGQASSTRVAADVPFNFIVGDSRLPAGKYMISELTSGRDALKINARDLQTSVIRLSNSIERSRGKNVAKLVFHRYGDSYFLAEVWGADRYGRQLAKSSQERHLEREIAAITSKSDMAMASYQRVEVLAVVR